MSKGKKKSRIDGGMCLKIVKMVFLAFICAFFLLSTPGKMAFASGEEMPVIRQGDANAAVYTLQTELKRFGFYHDDVDGNFGEYTKYAVIKFQQNAGIEDDGIVGSGTWRALRNYSGNGEISRGNTERKGGQQIANFARSFLGIPYVWGGAAPSGFDCSGFVYYIYNCYGILLPRVADEQYYFGHRVAAADIQPGDLVFYSTYMPGPSHVGIYVGNGQFIHASSAAGKVTLTPMSKPYYQERFLGAFRISR